MITLDQYFGKHLPKYEADLTHNLRENAVDLLDKVNELIERYASYTGKKGPTALTSGWRPATYNATIPNAAKTSKHIFCQAADLNDNGPMDRWCYDNPAILAEVGLWLEHPGWTDGWCHLQSVPPRGSWETRVFIPSMNEPMTYVYGTEPVYYKRPA